METPLDRIARALDQVSIGERDGVPVYLGLAYRLEMAEAALSVIRPEMDRLRERITELEGGTARVLPAKFVTDAMAQIPDALPPDFS